MDDDAGRSSEAAASSSRASRSAARRSSASAERRARHERRDAGGRSIGSATPITSMTVPDGTPATRPPAGSVGRRRPVEGDRTRIASPPLRRTRARGRGSARDDDRRRRVRRDVLRDAALEESRHGAEAARTDDDEVVAARLGDVLDRRGGIAGSLDEHRLDAVLLEDPLRLGQLGAMGDASSAGSIGARPGWYGMTLTTPTSASNFLAEVRRELERPPRPAHHRRMRRGSSSDCSFVLAGGPAEAAPASVRMLRALPGDVCRESSGPGTYGSRWAAGAPRRWRHGPRQLRTLLDGTWFASGCRRRCGADLAGSLASRTTARASPSSGRASPARRSGSSSRGGSPCGSPSRAAARGPSMTSRPATSSAGRPCCQGSSATSLAVTLLPTRAFLFDRDRAARPRWPPTASSPPRSIRLVLGAVARRLQATRLQLLDLYRAEGEPW